MRFSREDMEVLKPYEHHFRTAYYSGYVRGLSSRDVEVISSIYDKAMGSHYNVGGNCSVCLFEFCKRVGAAYFATMADMAAAKSEAPKVKEVVNPKKSTKKA